MRSPHLIRPYKPVDIEQASSAPCVPYVPFISSSTATHFLFSWHARLFLVQRGIQVVRALTALQAGAFAFGLYSISDIRFKGIRQEHEAMSNFAARNDKKEQAYIDLLISGHAHGILRVISHQHRVGVF